MLQLLLVKQLQNLLPLEFPWHLSVYIGPDLELLWRTFPFIPYQTDMSLADYILILHIGLGVSRRDGGSS